MSAKNKIKSALRKGRQTTPQGLYPKGIAKTVKEKDVSPENLWNLPFEEIKG